MRKHDIPTVTFYQKAGRNQGVAECYISISAIQLLGKPKEICFFNDTFGAYFRNRTIDDRKTYRINYLRNGSGNYFHKFCVVTDRIGSFKLVQENDKFYLENI